MHIVWLFILKILRMQDVLFHQYNAFTSPSGNIIWAAAMQLAWNELRQTFAHNQPLSLATQNPLSLKSISNFNQSHFQKGDISPDSIYVKCGYGQKTVDTINKETKQKFPQKTMPPLDFKLQDRDIISYAYLFKKLVFKTKFDRRHDKTFKFNNQSVSSFYAKNANQKKQVMVDSYINANNFIVHIGNKSDLDYIYLIKSEKNLTVDEAIKMTVEASNSNGSPLAKGDVFQMPVIRIDEQRSYQQLINLAFLNPELKEYFIRVMKEKIKLEVNESGAKVENQAVMVLSRCCMIEEENKVIVLDRDFWIVMKQTKNHPYLCVLIRKVD